MRFSDSLQAGVRAREVWAWALYDFANSGYTTVVLTAVFNAYFVSVIAGGAAWGTLVWTAALSASNLLLMLVSPRIGRWADGPGSKRQVLIVTTVLCIGATGLLGVIPPQALWTTVALVIVSSAAYGLGESTIAGYLPELARPHAMGRVSGWGWSLGYLGGMLSLGAGLVVVLQAQSQGQPATAYVPLTLWITAAVYALAAWPSLFILKERRMGARAPETAAVTATSQQPWRQLSATFPEFARLLRCIVAFQSGISVVIAVAAIYAEQVLAFQTAQTMMLIFLVNIAAALGAFAFGHLQDARGHRRMLAAALVGWVVMTVLAAMAEGPGLFWVAATLAGLCMGSSQSASRALASLFAPAHRRAEFLGLWGSAVRLAAVIGPVSYGLITWMTQGQHRVAVLVTGGFFVLGLWLLRQVDVDAGRQRGQSSSTEA
jgi:MFS transporter, UMF1 family